tara:strand:- start:106 stop:258 length:153 start_codon:yes stop_codon:yes gene_type:complete
MWKIIKKIVCKFQICCKSNCTLNDTNGDGVPDQITFDDWLNQTKDSEEDE